MRLSRLENRRWSLDIIGIACLTHLGSRSHPLLSGQRPDLYQPRATPWVCVWFYPPAGQRPASYVPSVPIGLNPDAASERGSIHRDYESRLQRSKWPLADKPRALPWAGMNDAFGVSDRPAGPPGCCLSGNCGPAPRRRADVMARKCPNSSRQEKPRSRGGAAETARKNSVGSQSHPEKVSHHRKRVLRSRPRGRHEA